MERGSAPGPVEANAFQRLLLEAGADDMGQWPPRDRPMDREGAARLLALLLNRPLPLRAFPQRMGACFLLQEVLSGGTAPWDELNRRAERFRQVAVLRPDGYLAWVLTGSTQQKVGDGRVELKDGVFQVDGFVLGRFYSGRSGVYRPVDAQLRPLLDSIPIQEVYDDADLLSRVLDGAEEAFFALAMVIGRVLSRPLDSIAALKDLPAGVAALIVSSPEYLERFKLMTTGEQIQAVSKLTTTLITMFAGGGAVSAGATRGLGGMEVAGISLSAQGTLALSRVVIPAGEAVAILASGAGGLIVLQQAAPPGHSNQPPTPRNGTASPTPSQAAGTRISAILKPGGRWIGEAGSSTSIRLLKGGQAEAEALFRQLSQGGRVLENGRYPGTLVGLPGGGTVGLRTVSRSGPITIDVQVPGLGIEKLKFVP